MRPLEMGQNTIKINKKYEEIFFVQYYGRLKELFDFTKLANYFVWLF